MKDNHGTGVLGIVLSQDNGWGTTGLAPWLPMTTTIDNGTQTQVAVASSVYLSTVYPQNDPLGSVGNAVDVAAAHIMTGDLLGGGRGAVLLIEVGKPFDLNHNSIYEPDEQVPAEYDPYTRQMIQQAVAAGIHVVEASGNGRAKLGDPMFGGLWNPVSTSSDDSGAILVGAGLVGKGKKAKYSSTGARIDTNAGASQAAGAASVPHNGVYTTGYGDYHPSSSQKPSNENEYYTDSFNGTSAASAIVAGALAAFTGVSRAHYGADITPGDLREVLRHTGDDSCASEGIGNRPNLEDLSDYLANRYLQTGSTDIDGDGIADYVTWRPPESTSSNVGRWVVHGSKQPNKPKTYWGGRRRDIPVPGNYILWFGQPGSELVLYRCPAVGSPLWGLGNRQCTWLQPMPSNGPQEDKYIGIGKLGRPGDIPVPLDTNGDGFVEPAVYRPMGTTGINEMVYQSDFGGRWYVLTRRYESCTGSWVSCLQPIVREIDWGYLEATPLAADFNGDGYDDLALFDRAGTWHILYFPYRHWTLFNDEVTLVPAFDPVCSPGDIPMTWRTSTVLGGHHRWGVGCYQPGAHRANLMTISGVTMQLDHTVTAGNSSAAGLVPRMSTLQSGGSSDLVVANPLTSSPTFANLSGSSIVTTGGLNAFTMV